MPRMRILTASKQETLDKPPLFNFEQRKQFFSFPKPLLEIARTLRTPNSQNRLPSTLWLLQSHKTFFLTTRLFATGY